MMENNNDINNLNNFLNNFTIDVKEDKVSKARAILGNEIEEFSDEEVEKVLVDFDYFINIWLDTFEKKVFKGKTLYQLSKGG